MTRTLFVAALLCASSASAVTIPLAMGESATVTGSYIDSGITWSYEASVNHRLIPVPNGTATPDQGMFFQVNVDADGVLVGEQSAIPIDAPFWGSREGTFVDGYSGSHCWVVSGCFLSGDPGRVFAGRWGFGWGSYWGDRLDVTIGNDPYTFAAMPEPGAALLFSLGILTAALNTRSRRCRAGR